MKPLFPFLLPALCVALGGSSQAQSGALSDKTPDKQLQQIEGATCTEAKEKQLEVPLRGDFNYCLLVFDESTGPTYEAAARIRVNDALISVHRLDRVTSEAKGPTGGTRTVSQYRSSDKTLLVVLDVEVQDDNCGGGDDSCCGAFYAGSLTLIFAKRRTAYPVYYYRGG